MPKRDESMTKHCKSMINNVYVNVVGSLRS